MGFGPISGTGLTSYSLGSRNVEITALAVHSNAFESETVRAICLAASDTGEPWAKAESELALDLQLHLAGALPRVSVEGTADRKRSAGPSGNPLYAHLQRLSQVAGEGCLDAIFSGSVAALQEHGHLDLSVIHGDGTTTAAKKGGDNLGFSGHKKVKGDKVVAFCDRNCNVIAPFVAAPGNRNESPLLRSEEGRRQPRLQRPQESQRR